jgi:hypothetical protein
MGWVRPHPAGTRALTAVGALAVGVTGLVITRERSLAWSAAERDARTDAG